METIQVSKDLLKKWCEKNMSAHTDWTGTRVETNWNCDSIDKFVDAIFEDLKYSLIAQQYKI